MVTAAMVEERSARNGGGGGEEEGVKTGRRHLLAHNHPLPLPLSSHSNHPRHQLGVSASLHFHRHT